MRSAEGWLAAVSRREAKLAMALSVWRCAAAISSSLFSTEGVIPCAPTCACCSQALRIASMAACSRCASARNSRAVRAVMAATQIIATGRQIPTSVIVTPSALPDPTSPARPVSTKNAPTSPSQHRVRAAAITSGAEMRGPASGSA